MIIGTFSFDADHNCYAGAIATLTLQREGIKFLPADKANEREPDYRIVQEMRGAAVELGAAWKRSSERGREYLSVVLDDPALPSPLNAALFLSTETGEATLIWQRQAKKAPETKTTASNGRRAKTRSEPRPV